MKVSPRSPPQSATADYLRGSELQAVHPRYYLLFIHLTILAWSFTAESISHTTKNCLY